MPAFKLCAHTHTYKYIIYVHTNILYTFIDNAFNFICICVHTHKPTHTHPPLCACTHMHTHSYTRTHTHTNTHMMYAWISGTIWECLMAHSHVTWYIYTGYYSCVNLCNCSKQNVILWLNCMFQLQPELAVKQKTHINCQHGDSIKGNHLISIFQTLVTVFTKGACLFLLLIFYPQAVEFHLKAHSLCLCTSPSLWDLIAIMYSEASTEPSPSLLSMFICWMRFIIRGFSWSWKKRGKKMIA